MKALRVQLTDEQKEKILKSLEERDSVILRGLGKVKLQVWENRGNKMGGPDKYPALTLKTSRPMKEKLREIKKDEL
jgi:hypothetical protein